MCVGAELVQSKLIGLRLARFAKSDLIGNNDAVAGFAQGLDCTLPCCTAEILAVHQDNRLAARPSALHVHVGHEQLLALRAELVALNGLRIAEVGKVWLSGSTRHHPSKARADHMDRSLRHPKSRIQRNP